MNNYNDLVSAVVELTEDDTAEMAAYIPTAVRLAEERLFRNIDLDLSKTQTFLSTQYQDYVAKPADYRVGYNFYVWIGNDRIRLIKRSEDFLNDYWPNVTRFDAPKYYADRDQSNFMLKPTPDAAYTLQLEYQFKPEPLSVSNQTNVWVEKFPDLLFYATMSGICEWQKDPERKQEWESKLQEAITSTNNEARRAYQEDNNDPGRNVLGAA